MPFGVLVWIAQGYHSGCPGVLDNVLEKTACCLDYCMYSSTVCRNDRSADGASTAPSCSESLALHDDLAELLHGGLLLMCLS